MHSIFRGRKNRRERRAEQSLKRNPSFRNAVRKMREAAEEQGKVFQSQIRARHAAAHKRAVQRRAEAAKYGEKYPEILAARSVKNGYAREKARNERIARNRIKRAERKQSYREAEARRRGVTV